MTYACRYRTGRKFWLGDEPCDPDICAVRNLRVAGPFVGYELRFAGRDPSSRAEVRVRDLRSGKYLRLAVRGGGSCVRSAFEPTLAAATDLELKGNGSVAWITRVFTCDPAGPFTYEVNRAPRAFSPRSRVERLDAGADVAPMSLSLNDGSISWTRGGASRSAPLP